ncbi:hypothetical protein SAMN02910369_00504 [Lachnospiraceae bacterium NE2001]|nr:hypothetical protein SAMN02910369_00504 [Lachnospiraceae bacterium NE2001]
MININILYRRIEKNFEVAESGNAKKVLIEGMNNIEPLQKILLLLRIIKKTKNEKLMEFSTELLNQFFDDFDFCINDEDTNEIKVEKVKLIYVYKTLCYSSEIKNLQFGYADDDEIRNKITSTDLDKAINDLSNNTADINVALHYCRIILWIIEKRNINKQADFIYGIERNNNKRKKDDGYLRGAFLDVDKEGDVCLSWIYFEKMRELLKHKDIMPIQKNKVINAMDFFLKRYSQRDGEGFTLPFGYQNDKTGIERDFIYKLYELDSPLLIAIGLNIMLDNNIRDGYEEEWFKDGNGILNQIQELQGDTAPVLKWVEIFTFFKRLSLLVEGGEWEKFKSVICNVNSLELPTHMYDYYHQIIKLTSYIMIKILLDEQESGISLKELINILNEKNINIFSYPDNARFVYRTEKTSYKNWKYAVNKIVYNNGWGDIEISDYLFKSYSKNDAVYCYMNSPLRILISLEDFIEGLSKNGFDSRTKKEFDLHKLFEDYPIRAKVSILEKESSTEGRLAFSPTEILFKNNIDNYQKYRGKEFSDFKQKRLAFAERDKLRSEMIKTREEFYEYKPFFAPPVTSGEMADLLRDDDIVEVKLDAFVPNKGIYVDKDANRVKIISGPFVSKFMTAYKNMNKDIEFTSKMDNTSEVSMDIAEKNEGEIEEVIVQKIEEVDRRRKIRDEIYPNLVLKYLREIPHMDSFIKWEDYWLKKTGIKDFPVLGVVYVANLDMKWAVTFGIVKTIYELVLSIEENTDEELINAKQDVLKKFLNNLRDYPLENINIYRYILNQKNVSRLFDKGNQNDYSEEEKKQIEEYIQYATHIMNSNKIEDVCKYHIFTNTLIKKIYYIEDALNVEFDKNCFKIRLDDGNSRINNRPILTNYVYLFKYGSGIEKQKKTRPIYKHYDGSNVELPLSKEKGGNGIFGILSYDSSNGELVFQKTEDYSSYMRLFYIDLKKTGFDLSSNKNKTAWRKVDDIVNKINTANIDEMMPSDKKRFVTSFNDFLFKFVEYRNGIEYLNRVILKIKYHPFKNRDSSCFMSMKEIEDLFNEKDIRELQETYDYFIITVQNVLKEGEDIFFKEACKLFYQTHFCQFIEREKFVEAITTEKVTSPMINRYIDEELLGKKW